MEELGVQLHDVQKMVAEEMAPVFWTLWCLYVIPGVADATMWPRTKPTPWYSWKLEEVWVLCDVPEPELLRGHLPSGCLQFKILKSSSLKKGKSQCFLLLAAECVPAHISLGHTALQFPSYGAVMVNFTVFPNSTTWGNIWICSFLWSPAGTQESPVKCGTPTAKVLIVNVSNLSPRNSKNNCVCWVCSNYRSSCFISVFGGGLLLRDQEISCLRAENIAPLVLIWLSQHPQNLRICQSSLSHLLEAKLSSTRLIFILNLSYSCQIITKS